MLRTFLKLLVAVVLIAFIVAELRWIARFIGPEFEPWWAKAKARARRHGLNLDGAANEHDVEGRRAA